MIHLDVSIDVEAEFPSENWHELMTDLGSLAAMDFKKRLEDSVSCLM